MRLRPASIITCLKTRSRNPAERLTTMSRMLSAAGLVAIVVVGGGYLQVTKAQGRAPTAPRSGRPAPVQASTTKAAAAVPVPERAVVDKYCVTCHNERAKIGGLALDNVDLADAKKNAELLEKVVRKLRGGLMPPEGRPRPDHDT